MEPGTKAVTVEVAFPVSNETEFGFALGITPGADVVLVKFTLPVKP